MVLFWILGIAALLAVLLCLTQLGIRVSLRGRAYAVDVRAGVFRYRVYPRQKARKARKEKEEPEEEPEEEEPASKGFRPSFEDIRDALRTLPGPLLRALRRILRGVRVDPLTVDLVIGGQAEPADAASAYGYAHAAVWAGMPVLERWLTIPKPHIGIGIDFDAPEHRADGDIGVSVRVGTLLAAGLCVAVPVIRLLRRYLRRNRQKRRAVSGA